LYATACRGDSLYLLTILPSYPFFVQCYGAHRYLHSFPTRRSSDLVGVAFVTDVSAVVDPGDGERCEEEQDHRGGDEDHREHVCRSEEHTSELQSRFDLVCRLLLEKKKNKRNTRTGSEVETKTWHHN